MNTLLIGFLLGALVFGGVAIKYERARRANRDLEAAKAGVKVLRSVFWRAVGALLRAAIGPVFLLVVAAAIVYLIKTGGSR